MKKRQGGKCVGECGAVRRLGALALWADCGHRSQAGLLMGMNHSPSVSLNTAWPALHIITLLPSSLLILSFAFSVSCSLSLSLSSHTLQDKAFLCVHCLHEDGPLDRVMLLFLAHLTAQAQFDVA